MREVKLMLERANELIRRADHMFYTTYPLVRDTRLIITMAENIMNGMMCAMEAVLMYEKLYKKISDYPEDFNGKVDIFKNNVAKRYDININHIMLIKDIKIFLDDKKKSKVEFVKNDRYILFNQKQELKSLGIDKIKQNLNISKDFLRNINGRLSNVTSRF